MSTYLPLEEAAKITWRLNDELIEMRSRGEIFGLRDGSSWKFKSDEIERVQQELQGDVLSDDPSGSSILVSERDGGSSKSGLVLTGEDKAASNSSSDLRLSDEDAIDSGSDVALIPDPSSGSGLRLVNRSQPAPSDGDDDLLALDDSEELELDASSLSLGPGNGIAGGSELRLADDDVLGDSGAMATPPLDGSQVIGGSELKPKGGSAAGTPDLVRGDSDADIDLDGDLHLSGDDNDDLVLGSASDLGLGSDSGINLMSPSDSGLSLEDEPIDLAGTGISGLDLGGSSHGEGSGRGLSGIKSGSGSDIGSGNDGSLGSLSGIDFAAAEDFQLSPSDGMEIEEDSGSQVIEIEDSTEIGAIGGADGMGAMVATGDSEAGFMDDGLGAAGTEGNLAAAAAFRGTPEVHWLSGKSVRFSASC